MKRWGGMTRPNLIACRRALREIQEIAAAARLQDSQMTEAEAVAAIAAIAVWASVEGPTGGAACGRIMQRLGGALGNVELEELDDHQAGRLFDQVVEALTRAA